MGLKTRKDWGEKMMANEFAEKRHVRGWVKTLNKKNSPATGDSPLRIQKHSDMTNSFWMTSRRKQAHTGEGRTIGSNMFMEKGHYHCNMERNVRDDRAKGGLGMLR